MLAALKNRVNECWLMFSRRCTKCAVKKEIKIYSQSGMALNIGHVCGLILLYNKFHKKSIFFGLSFLLMLVSVGD